jgi:hypothetical protein
LIDIAPEHFRQRVEIQHETDSRLGATKASG